LVLDDFNKQTGKEKSYKQITRKFTLHEKKSNNNGEIATNFAI
jgi:hypothetical protein